MMMMAPRSSMIASASRKILSDGGAREPSSASTPRAKAISVAAGNCPASQGPHIAPYTRDIEQHRTHHATGSLAIGRQRGTRQGGQRSREDLALDLEPDDHEEDRHQSVVHPEQQRLGNGEVADLDCERNFQQMRVECAERAVLMTIAMPAAAHRTMPPADFEPHELLEPGQSQIASPSVRVQSSAISRALPASRSSARFANARMLATRSALPVSSVIARENCGPSRPMQVWPAASP